MRRPDCSARIMCGGNVWGISRSFESMRHWRPVRLGGSRGRDMSGDRGAAGRGAGTGHPHCAVAIASSSSAMSCALGRWLGSCAQPCWMRSAKPRGVHCSSQCPHGEGVGERNTKAGAGGDAGGRTIVPWASLGGVTGQPPAAEW